MEYVRNHIKKHAVYIYGRAIGVSLLLFSLLVAVILATGSNNIVTFSSIGSILFLISMLIGISILIILINVINSHISVTKLMNDKEHAVHSKNVGLWSIIWILGVIVLLLPLWVLNRPEQVTILLFSFGAILLLLYLSIGGMFKHYFHEIGFGALALLIIFAINSFYVLTVPYILEYFVTIISLIIIFGISGIAIIFNSSQALVKDYIDLSKKLESKNKSHK